MGLKNMLVECSRRRAGVRVGVWVVLVEFSRRWVGVRGVREKELVRVRENRG